MAHPHLMPFTDVPEAVEQGTILGHSKECAAELAPIPYLVPAPDLSAKLMAHNLLAITDAENRDASLEQDFGRAGRTFIGHASGRTGQDDALGLHPVKRFFGHAERGDFGIDARFAHAARNQLGYLAAEIDDEDGIGEMLLVHGGAIRCAANAGKHGATLLDIDVRSLRATRVTLPGQNAAGQPDSCKKLNMSRGFLICEKSGVTLLQPQHRRSGPPPLPNPAPV